MVWWHEVKRIKIKMQLTNLRQTHNQCVRCLKTLFVLRHVHVNDQ